MDEALLFVDDNCQGLGRVTCLGEIGLERERMNERAVMCSVVENGLIGK